MKRTWLRYAIAVLALCAVLAGMEAFLRIHYGAGHPVLVVADPACGYIFKPGQDLTRFGGERVFINQFGMRSDEIGPKAPGQLRILFVGDSVTYGTTRVDQQDIFTSRLQRQLPRILHRPVEVLNASASAWAIWNEYQYVRSRGIFGADIVLLVLNTGDLDQAPAYIPDVGNALLTEQPRSAAQEIWDRLVLPRLLALKPDKGARIDRPSPQQEQQNLAMLAALRSYVEQHGARFAIVFIPFRGMVRDGATASIPPALQAWAVQNHLPLLDETAALAAFPTAQVSIDGDHLTGAGNAVTARAIEQHWTELTR